MHDEPPIDVDRALTTLGLVATRGTGTAGGWLARRPEDEAAAFELLVLAAPLDRRLVDDVDRFVQLQHPHLAPVRAAVSVDPGRTGVLVDHVEGVSLAAIRRARAPMTDGECVTLLVPLSEALSAMAAAGVAHGAVDADHILVRPDGRPVLVAPRPGLVGAALPEDDLPRLLSAVVDVMPEEDGVLLAGPSSVARLRPVLDALLRDGCSADEVVRRCFATVEPESVRLPDPAALAAASLLTGPGRPFPVSAGATHRSLPRPSTGAVRGRRAAAPRPRVRRSAGVVALTALLLVSAGIGLHALTGRAADVAPGQDGHAVEDRDDPAGAAAELTRRRADVLRSGEVTGLAGVAVDGGPSATADAAVIRSLGGRTVDGLSAEVGAVRITGTPTGDEADVSVTSTMSGYVAVGADGDRSTVAPTPPRTVLLHLRWTAGGWRVWSVSEATAAP